MGLHRHHSDRAAVARSPVSSVGFQWWPSEARTLWAFFGAGKARPCTAPLAPLVRESLRQSPPTQPHQVSP